MSLLDDNLDQAVFAEIVKKGLMEYYNTGIIDIDLNEIKIFQNNNGEICDVDWNIVEQNIHNLFVYYNLRKIGNNTTAAFSFLFDDRPLNFKNIKFLWYGGHTTLEKILNFNN